MVGVPNCEVGSLVVGASFCHAYGLFLFESRKGVTTKEIVWEEHFAFGNSACVLDIV